jgi:FlaA1/EpsC-like NDP-sugar epimerase/DNA-binding CsgD family transcriptional regulator
MHGQDYQLINSDMKRVSTNSEGLNTQLENLPLSKSEMRVARLLAWGFTQKEIADRLFISPLTVQAHLKNIYRELGIHKETDLTRWFIFMLDLGASFLAIIFSLLIRNNLVIGSLSLKDSLNTILLVGLVNTFVFSSLRTFRGIVRFTGLQDALRVFIAVILSTVALFSTQYFYDGVSPFYFSTKIVFILYAFLCFSFMLGYRMAVKYVFEIFRNHKRLKKVVAIYGAGLAGMATKRVLSHDNRTTFQIIAFIDDDSKKTRKSLDGITIVSFQEFRDMVNLANIDEVIISTFSLSPQRKNELVDFCLDHDINVLTVPPYGQWADGTFAPKQLKNITSIQQAITPMD